MKVATHPGSFHADDVFAVATLRLAFGDDFEVIRTRDPEELERADMRVDVGMRYDPESGDFDHHQAGRAGARDNGILYASFGLVWREYGPRICQGWRELAERVDRTLVQGIDALDNGQTIARPLLEDGAREMNMAGLIGGFNPAWDDDETSEDEAFASAVEFARGILEREIASARAVLRAEKAVRQALRERDDERLLFLDRSMPWQRVIAEEAPEVLFVICPKAGDWCAQAVPRHQGEFDSKISFPKRWGGMRDEELQQASGVADAVFCHPAHFFACARSREGVLELVRKAIAEAERRKRRRRPARKRGDGHGRGRRSGRSRAKATA